VNRPFNDTQEHTIMTASALVTTGWLAEHLTDPNVRIVEVDEDTTRYHTDHIPGAVAWSWSADLHHPVRRDYVDREGLEHLLSRSGVGPDATVVLYGGNSNWFAAYAYWLLTYRGFDRVRLLDGGRAKWESDWLPLTDVVPDHPPTDVRITGPERPELRALRSEVLESVGTAHFIDVRSPEEYRGEKLAPDHLPQEQPYVAGHVPGARNVPWAQAVNGDGTFRSVAELEALYGPQNGAATITYCRIGERSSHTWFVLSELLGRHDVKNYDGSWTEYGSLVGVPVEVGADD
jgi:thiosulfate/3-mercaptopyruvate sulfurtransferase